MTITTNEWKIHFVVQSFIQVFIIPGNKGQRIEASVKIVKSSSTKVQMCIGRKIVID